MVRLGLGLAPKTDAICFIDEFMKTGSGTWLLMPALVLLTPSPVKPLDLA